MTPCDRDDAQRVTGVTLRDYQREALDAIDAGERGGIRRQLVVLPTGTGKTVVFSELIRRRRGRALILVHRDELVRQAVEKLRVVSPGTRVGVVKAERDEHDRTVVVAAVQTVAQERRLARLAADVDLVVVDEAHHLAAETYQRILERLNVGASDGPLGLGVTATPDRADGEPLAGWQLVYRRELLDMIRAGYLSDLRALQIRLAVDFNALHTRAGDFIESEMDVMLRAAQAPTHVVTAWRTHAAGRPTLVFTPTVALAGDMVDAFRAKGVAAEMLSGTTPINERHDILARLHRGDTTVVANCAVLTEGFDEPSIGCIVLARPTRSRTLYLQMIGRGTRRYPGKADCMILDLAGATTRHDLVTAAALFGVPAHGAVERSVLDAVDAVRRAEAQQAQRGTLVVRAVELFRARPLRWVPAGGGRFALAVGEHGTLLLDALPDARWQVRQRTRDRRDVVLQTGLDVGFAQGWAEDHARRLGAEALINPAAAWRQAPASDKQLLALRRCRVPIPSGITKGAAADLLTAAFARGGR